MLNIVSVIDGTHIPLFEKPNTKVIAFAIDFYNHKKFHNIVLQGVCDCDKNFWNVSTSQHGGVVNGGSFKLNSLYMELKFRKISIELVVDVDGVQVYPFLLGDVAYPL